MDNPEEVLQSLEEFAKLKPKDVPRELEEYLLYVAKTGDPVYQWSLVKCLFREKMLNVITDFYESCPSIDLTPCPNVDPFNYETMKTSLLERLDSFTNAPFTVQRLCELLTAPKKEYTRVDKFMRAIEKNIPIAKTKEPFGWRYDDDAPAEFLMIGVMEGGGFNIGDAFETVTREGVNLIDKSETDPLLTDAIRVECEENDVEKAASTDLAVIDIRRQFQSCLRNSRPRFRRRTHKRKHVCSSVHLPLCANVDNFNYDAMKESLLEGLDSCANPPFTVQRLCNFLTTPRKEYTRVDKFMRTIAKNFLVASKREPGCSRRSNDTAQPEFLMNGVMEGRGFDIGEAIETVSSDGVNPIDDTSVTDPVLADSIRVECEEMDMEEAAAADVAVAAAAAATWDKPVAECEIKADPPPAEVKHSPCEEDSSTTTSSTTSSVPEFTPEVFGQSVQLGTTLDNSLLRLTLSGSPETTEQPPQQPALEDPQIETKTESQFEQEQVAAVCSITEEPQEEEEEEEEEDDDDDDDDDEEEEEALPVSPDITDIAFQFESYLRNSMLRFSQKKRKRKPLCSNKGLNSS